MSTRHNFTYKSSTVFWIQSQTVDQEMDFLYRYFTNAEPYAMDRHVYFVDAASYGVPEAVLPNWINVVRDPIERFVSSFHYLRQTKRWKNKPKPPEVRDKEHIYLLVCVSVFSAFSSSRHVHKMCTNCSHAPFVLHVETRYFRSITIVQTSKYNRVA